MPNFCNNELRIDGDKKEIKKFKEKAKGKGTDLSLNNFVKIPKLQEKNWYDWNVKNWGTKWDIETDLLDDTDVSLFYCFDSAWSPPIEWLEKVVKKYPKLNFSLKYDEPGVGFMGVAKSEEGELIDNCLEY